MTEMTLKMSKRIYWASGIVSICGIIFEVLFGALGSYILGDGVKQYTLTIALFLTGMGIGAFLSEKIMKQLMAAFVLVEFLVAFIGGFSSFVLFGITAYLPSGTDALFLYSVILIIGLLTGLELPLLIRKANEIGISVNKSTARVLFSDYAGGLIGGLLFAFWLRPEFGMVKTAFLVALVNLAVAFWMLFTFKAAIRGYKVYAVIGIAIGAALLWGAFYGDETAFGFEQKLYADPIIYEQQTKYQKIIITKEQGDTRLYLDGNLQFSSTDEDRYHETLVHPTAALAGHPSNALILGGGDGLAARELLKYKSISNITLVDLDPAMTHLAKTNKDLVRLNKHSMTNHRMHIVNGDAFQFLKKNHKTYDVILVDLPDPNNESLNKVYTEEFYHLVKSHLTPNGAVNIQSTSPYFATEVYWTINKTVQQAGLYTDNIHNDVPSFGDWGFVLGARHPIDVNKITLKNVPMRYLTTPLLHGMTQFGKDEDSKIYKDGKRVVLGTNTLIHPTLIEMYQKAWLYY